MATFTTGNGPKLAAAANALGVTGTTDNKKATALRQAVAGFSNLEMNEFINNFTNKVLVSTMWKHMKFEDPFTKAFIQEGVSIAGAKEYFASKLLKTHTFDSTKRMPASQERAQNLNIVFRTVIREYITNTVSMVGVKAAFASETAFGEWVMEQTKLLSETLQIRLFTLMQTLIFKSIKNVITKSIGVDKMDERFVFINGISLNMSLPTVKYNLGFDNPEDVAHKDEVRKQISKRSNLFLIMNTNMKNKLDGETMTVKFHNQYFDVSSYKGVLFSDTLTDDEVIILSDEACKGHFRVHEVASNTWAANMTIETFLHYWIVFGVIPWANGVKIDFK